MVDTQMDIGVWQGVQSLLDNYVGIQSDDIVILLYTSDSSESAILVSAALEARSIKCTRVWMAPLYDEEFSERLLVALPSSDEVTSHLVVLGFERDTMSHTSVVAKAISKYGKSKCKVFRAISACPSLFSIALKASPEDLSAINTSLLERFMPAKKLRVKTAGGTDVSITIDSNKHRWISNRGIGRSGSVVILPAGEVATFPATINGVFVADFAFNVNAITTRDSRLQNNPVTIWIEEGRAVKYECGDPAISQFLEECFHTHCAYNVGEIGFGTNFCVSEPIFMNSHINERRPGIHLGFGQHNQDPNVVGYQCTIHLDLIAQGGIVWVDEDLTPINLENVAPSSQLHPDTTRAEDVFSPDTEDTDELDIDDCCGILTTEGLKLFTNPECYIDGKPLD